MTSDSEVWVGIDVGTQGVRVVAIGIDGTEIGSGSAPLASRRERHSHTQDPNAWWEALSIACRAAVDGLDPLRFCGVAVDATSGTLVPLGPGDKPIGPASMYDDLSGRHHVNAVNAQGRDLWQRLGYQRIQPTWALPRVIGLLEHHADDLRRVVHQTDFINERLVGDRVPTDTSTALKTGVDLDEGRWPSELFEALGISSELFPPVVRSGERIGSVTANAARETGLPEGLAVFAGMTDGCAAQLGAGVVAPGSWNSVLGTTLILKGVTSERLHDETGAVYSHRSPDGSWLPGGASSSGAGAMQTLLAGRDLDALAIQAATVGPAGFRGVVYPLAGTGERFPFVAPAAESFAIGSITTDLDLYLGLMLGLAFVERLAFQHLERLGAPTTGRLVATGGGTRSAAWNQLRANVLGRALDLPASTQPAVGAAMLAASSAHGLETAAERMVHIAETVQPNLPVGSFDGLFDQFAHELTSRGWLPQLGGSPAEKAAT